MIKNKTESKLNIEDKETEPDRTQCDSNTGLHEEERIAMALPTSGSLWIKSRDFVGLPNPNDFRLSSFSIPELKPKEILVEALYWSVENYMREFDTKIGSPMIGEQVGCIIASQHRDFPLWSLVVCPTGWRNRSVINPDVTLVRLVHDIRTFPISVSLGILGFPGLCAYFGFLEICRPKPGDIVLVNAAAGAIGSVVGQLAKHVVGCTVIAFAASKDRCNWVRELGFDYVYCKTVEVSAALARQAPRGVDCFVDCVGGRFTKDAVHHMKPTGTIVVFGYNSWSERRFGTAGQPREPYHMVCMTGGKISTCSILDFKPKWCEAESKLLDWMSQGKLRFRETTFEGFENLPSALTSLYDDTSVGNVIVKSASLDSFTPATSFDMTHGQPENAENMTL